MTIESKKDIEISRLQPAKKALTLIHDQVFLTGLAYPICLSLEFLDRVSCSLLRVRLAFWRLVFNLNVGRQ